MTDISKEQYDASGWSASLYNKAANFVYSPEFTDPVIQLLKPAPGERIIDFGCGSGEVTLQLEKLVKAREGEGLVVGLDISENMIKQANANGVTHASVANIQSMLDDKVKFFGQDLKFDAVFSTATLHWCKQNPRGVLRNAKQLLKPSGRLVVEMGGFMNCIGVRSAIHRVLQSRGYDPKPVDPWFFPSIEEYRELLISEGFKPLIMELVPRVTPLPEGVYGWLATFARSSFLQGFSDDEAEQVMREVEEVCRVDCQDSSGAWTMMYMRLRFSAVIGE